MSELETKVVDILDKVENIITSYTPEVTEAALTAIQVTAATRIFEGLLLIVFMVAAYYGVKLSSKKLTEKIANTNFYDRTELEFTRGALYVIATFIFIFGFLTIMTSLFNIWVWTALFNPELALVHQITGL